MIVPGLRTPRMTAHRWVASMTTPTPCGSSRVLEELGDLLGEPLLDLEPPAYISTTRGIFDSPITRPRGM